MPKAGFAIIADNQCAAAIRLTSLSDFGFQQGRPHFSDAPLSIWMRDALGGRICLRTSWPHAISVIPTGIAQRSR